MSAITIRDLFAEETKAGVAVFAGGRDTVDYIPLSTEEEASVRKAIKDGLAQIRAVSPKIYDEIEKQTEAFVKWAGVAKATFPNEQPIKYPSEPGSIGVNFLIPPCIDYTTTASSTLPSYTSYTAPTWALSLTAGTISYLFGSGSYYFKACPKDDNHTMIVVAQNGLIEVETTPKIDQIKFKTEVMNKYAAWAATPLITESIDDNKNLYMYNTIGQFPLFHNLGAKLEIMPCVTGASNIAPIGLCFYEHAFWDNGSSTGFLVKHDRS